MKPNFLCLMLFLASPLFGQTRAEELERQRSEYQKQLGTEKNSGAEEVFRALKDNKVFERVNYGYNGLSAKLGGLVTGGGFAFGPQYFRDDLRNGALTVRAAAQTSFRKYQKADAELLLPKLFGGNAA